MTCYHPLAAWCLPKGNKKTGKDIISFRLPMPATGWQPINLPCGQCIGCRLDYSRSWAVRCMHEASMHEHNAFITLTYDDEHVKYSCLTGEQTLYKKDLQDFLKRLRRRIEPLQIRFYGCGEYGEHTYRPHYHVIIFGYGFPDKIPFKYSGTYMTYISKLLEECWPHGFSLVADVSFDSCAYVARYVMKKLNGELGESKYEGIQKEFVNMSRRPGIARDWYEKYKSDVYPYDEVVIHSNDRTRVLRPPRYYDKLFDIDNPTEMEIIKQRRINAAKKHEEEFSTERLLVKEKIKKQKLDKLERMLE